MAKKHWIYIKRGLSEDPKHRAAMGECIWLYMHIIDRADWETGVAFDWKDREEAADMSMPVDTLRRQRQKLEELDYIRAQQKQHAQDIYIMEWKNPRDYGAEVKNPRNQGSHELPPSEGSHGQPPSTPEGLNQGLNQGSNQVQAQVKTPTSSSVSKSEINKTSPVYDFKNMTVGEARKIPTLKMYAEATDYFPGSILWETVHNAITENNLTFEKIHAAAIAWAGRGYKPSNVQGILEWAINGIPTNGNQPGAKPALDEKGIQETQKMLAEKMTGKFVPRPANIERPKIGRQS